MTHDDVQALASEYVLGLTDEVTRARIATHLRDCGACRVEMNAVAQTFDAIGRSVPDAAPPAALRARILAIPTQVPQAITSAPVVPVVTAGSRRVVLPWLAAAAAGLVAVASLWQAGTARAEVERLRVELAQAQMMAGEAQIARASLTRELEEVSQQAAVLRASDLVAYTLAGDGSTRNTHARAYVTHKDGMVFTADGLPALPAGKVYQLWVIVDAKPVSVGVFSPDATGRVHAVMATPDIASMPGAVAVTLEPTGGLAQPSSAPILVGTPTVS